MAIPSFISRCITKRFIFDILTADEQSKYLFDFSNLQAIMFLGRWGWPASSRSEIQPLEPDQDNR